MKRVAGLFCSFLLVTPVFTQDKDDPKHKPEALGKAFPHKAGCPKECKSCQTALGKAWACLARTQDASGSWEAGNGGTVVITAIAGLALMASGESAYLPNVERAAKFILNTVAPGHKGKGKTASGEEFSGFGNWDLGYAALFLGEYYVLNPKPDTEDRIRFIIEKIRDQRESNGGWGHAPAFAYRDLVVASTACMAGLGSLKMAGFAIPDEVIASGVKYFEDSSEGGTVGYSPRQGQKGWGHAGRAAGAAFGMWKLGVTGKYFDRVTKFVKQGIKTIHLDHASPTLHYLWGGLYAYLLGPEAWAEFKKEYLDLWLAMQQEDGSVLCPTDADVKFSLGLDTDAEVGPNYPTAVFALVFASPLEKTRLHRLKPSKGGRSVATGKGLGLGKKPGAKPFLGIRADSFAGSLEVLQIVAKGPAETGGLQKGDMLLEFRGKKIEKNEELRGELAKCSPGQKVTLTLLRGGGRLKADVKLTEAEPPKAEPVSNDEGDTAEGAPAEPAPPQPGELF